MKFHVSSKMKTRIQVSYTLPDKYEKYRLPGAMVEFTSGPFGFFISQQLNTEYYVVSQQHFMISKNVRLYTYVEVPTVVLSCTLMGELEWLPKGIEKKPLNAGEYALHYIPTHPENIMYLKKGRYESINFELNESRLNYFIQDNPKLSRIHNFLASTAEEGLQLDLNNINMYVRDQIAKIKERNPDTPGYRIFIQNRINDILMQYLQELNDAGKGDQLVCSKHEKQIREISEYLRSNLDKTITVKDLANENNVHVKTLMRGFKKYMGVTIPAFVYQQRMSAVEQLLRDTERTIFDIADKTGFVDVSHLAKKFKAKFQMPPSEYRQKWKAASSVLID